MRVLLSFLFLLALMPSESHAFKWSKCRSIYKSWGITESKSKNIGTVIADHLMQMTTQATFQSSTSTTSYVSSTGDCAAFAKAEEERFHYIAETMVELKMEASEGQGEHITSLANLYGCNSKAQPTFIEMMKSNHAKIFSSSINNSAEVTEKITDSLMNTEVLRNNCDIEKI